MCLAAFLFNDLWGTGVLLAKRLCILTCPRTIRMSTRKRYCTQVGLFKISSNNAKQSDTTGAFQFFLPII